MYRRCRIDWSMSHLWCTILRLLSERRCPMGLKDDSRCRCLERRQQPRKEPVDRQLLHAKTPSRATHLRVRVVLIPQRHGRIAWRPTISASGSATRASVGEPRRAPLAISVDKAVAVAHAEAGPRMCWQRRDVVVERDPVSSAVSLTYSRSHNRTTPSLTCRTATYPSLQSAAVLQSREASLWNPPWKFVQRPGMGSVEPVIWQ